MKRNALIIALMFFCGTCFAGLTLITSTNSFGPSTLHESFNEAIDYNNAVESSNERDTFHHSLVIVGTSTSYVYASTGLTLSSPIPNLDVDQSPQMSVVSFLQHLSFGTSYGEVTAQSQIPGGANAHFLLEYGQLLQSNHQSFTLTLPGNGASSVGGYWIMGGSTPGTDHLIITAFGLSGNLLGSANVPACNVSNWASNFYGFASSDGPPIKSIGIDYSTNLNAGCPGVANLMFEPYVPPATTLTIAISNGVPVITFAAIGGCTYRLDFNDGNWQRNSWVTNPTDRIMSISDTTAAGHPRRIYRVEAANP